jgi:hypothetical protein
LKSAYDEKKICVHIFSFCFCLMLDKNRNNNWNLLKVMNCIKKISLCQLRCISWNTFQSSSWLQVVKVFGVKLYNTFFIILHLYQVTGLAKIILKWSDLIGIALWCASIVVHLFQHHCFNVTLLVVLKTWSLSSLPNPPVLGSPLTQMMVSF